MNRPIRIVLPAWGEYFVSCAVNYVIPSVDFALAEAGEDAIWFVYTDNAGAFTEALDGYKVVFKPPPRAGDTYVAGQPQKNHVMMSACHSQVLSYCAPDDLAAIINADCVVSKELFAFARKIFRNSSYLVLATGNVRVMLKGAGDLPPIGASGRELWEWAWERRHPIIENCVWGRGKTTFPVTLFFENEGSVIQHCGHLHPIIIRNCPKVSRFRGTIDDGLWQQYQDNEIFYNENINFAITDISPLQLSQSHRDNSGAPLSVDYVAAWGNVWNRNHIRNLRHPIRICGTGPVDTEPVYQIIDKIFKKLSPTAAGFRTNIR